MAEFCTGGHHTSHMRDEEGGWWSDIFFSGWVSSLWCIYLFIPPDQNEKGSMNSSPLCVSLSMASFSVSSNPSNCRETWCWAKHRNIWFLSGELISKDHSNGAPVSVLACVVVCVLVFATCWEPKPAFLITKWGSFLGSEDILAVCVCVCVCV